MTSDNLEGGTEVANHLLTLGHRRLAYLGAGDEYVSRMRQNGFQAALQEAGIRLPAARIGDAD